MKDYTMLFEGCITILFVIITMFVIPWIKTKISAELMKQIINWVSVAVEAAEMIFKEPGSGDEKKTHVKEFMESILEKMNAKLEKYDIYIDTKFLDNLIEAAVLEIQQKKGKKEN